MQHLPLQDNLIIKIAGYILVIVGPIISFCGILISYIYATDRKQDRADHKKLFEKSDNHGERISKIEGKFKL